MQSELASAETAAQGASSSISSLSVGLDALTPLIQAVRKQLDIEKAAEGLTRTASSAKTLADLPKLEAAILAARKVGAEELHPEAYK